MVDDVFFHLEGDKFVSFRQIDEADLTDIKIALLIVIDIWAKEVSGSPAKVTVDPLAVSVYFFERVRVEAGGFGAGSYPAVSAEQNQGLLCAALGADCPAQSLLRAAAAD